MQVTDSRLAARLPVRSDSASRRSPVPSMVIGGMSHSSTPFGGNERYSPASDSGATSMTNNNEQSCVLFCVYLCIALQLQSNAHACASAQGEAHVLLHTLPVIDHAQGILPRHPVQQEQHRAARQVVLQLSVSAQYVTRRCACVHASMVG